VFLVMATCGTYYRTSIRRVRRNFRDDVNRELAKHKLETDTESLEWINSFLVKFWPIFQPVLAETIINSVDQVLSTSCPAFLDSLRMKTFTLGNKVRKNRSFYLYIIRELRISDACFSSDE
jgi:Ca2+-dependent lipid-binding protein